MSALTFTLKATPAHRVDCSPLTPDQLTGKNAADIAALTCKAASKLYVSIAYLILAVMMRMKLYSKIAIQNSILSVKQ